MCRCHRWLARCPCTRNLSAFTSFSTGCMGLLCLSEELELALSHDIDPSRSEERTSVLGLPTHLLRKSLPGQISIEQARKNAPD